MTGARFMAVFWDDDAARAEAERIADAAIGALGLRPAARFSRGVALTEAATPVVAMADGAGLVIGELFARGSARRIDRLDAAAARAIEADNAVLINDYWGEYVALLAGRDDPLVLRDPSGARACYAFGGQGVAVIMSDVAIATTLGLIDGAINWTVLGQWLAHPGIRTEATCLVGVDEILPGTVWSVAAGSPARRTVWTPWAFAAPDRQFADREEAVDALRETAFLATRACAAQSTSALLEMSGGLDSSIVAACLRHADIPVTCVSLWAPDPGADERRYAQAVADHIKAPIHFVRLAAEDVDIAAVSPIRKPRPVDHPLKRAADLALEREGLNRKSDNYFSGSGGDYVLGYLSSSAPAADALLARGWGPTFFSAVADIAALHECSVWKAAALAARKARGPACAPDAAGLFISAELRAQHATLHPWLDAPRLHWPGKREQIDSLIRCQGIREERDRRRIAPLRMPLLTQPMVETCLRVPSWMAVTGGRNRAVARDAFADHLPASILQRRTKGNFTSFNAALFTRHRGALRDMLLGGRLIAQGLLDRGALERYLDADRPLADTAYPEILDLAAVELWTRSWA